MPRIPAATLSPSFRRYCGLHSRIQVSGAASFVGQSTTGVQGADAPSDVFGLNLVDAVMVLSIAYTRSVWLYRTRRAILSGTEPGVIMALDLHPPDLKLVREADGLELDLETLQGTWTERQYVALTDQTNRLIEYTDGIIEVLPMPTDAHQVIVAFLYEVFRAFLRPLGGRVLFAPLRLRIRAGKHREPDLLLVLDAEDPRRQNSWWLGADLVVEVVSPDNPERDTVKKRADYAEAQIREYWIVYPQDETITVLILEDAEYVEYGIFRRGETVMSSVLAGLAVSVDEVLDAR
jgi:Uma2 family endonuclease